MMMFNLKYETRAIIGNVLKVLLWTAGVIILIPILCYGGCMAVGVAGGAQAAMVNAVDQRNFKRAINSPLPGNVDVVVSGEWGELIELMRSSPPLAGLIVSQNESARYGLTYRGLYDFATGRHTDLACAAEPLSQANHRRDAYWIGDDIFYWKGCAFAVDDLRPGIYDDSYCFRCSLEGAREALAPILPVVDVVYYPEGYHGFYYFVLRQPDRPAAVHTVVLTEEAGRGLLPELSAPMVELPQASLESPYYSGRSIPPGEERPSPDGQLKVIFDGQKLTVLNNSNNDVLAEVRADEFHTASKKPIWAPDDWHKMSVYGWTDDSKHILFSVETSMIHAGGSTRLFAIKQVFVLNVP